MPTFLDLPENLRRTSERPRDVYCPRLQIGSVWDCLPLPRPWVSSWYMDRCLISTWNGWIGKCSRNLASPWKMPGIRRTPSWNSRKRGSHLSRGRRTQWRSRRRHSSGMVRCLPPSGPRQRRGQNHCPEGSLATIGREGRMTSTGTDLQAFARTIDRVAHSMARPGGDYRRLGAPPASSSSRRAKRKEIWLLEREARCCVISRSGFLNGWKATRYSSKKLRTITRTAGGCLKRRT